MTKKQAAWIIVILALIAVLVGLRYFDVNKPTMNSINITPISNSQEETTLQTVSESSVSETSEESSLENVTTPLHVKSIYKKNNAWWADVDYVTHMEDQELMAFQINNGDCVVPNMTKAQTLAYAKLQTRDTIDESLLNRCFAWDTFEFGGNVNQNPLIRSFPFASNYQTINYCPPEQHPSPQELSSHLVNQPYTYSLYTTQGIFIKKATITDSQITTFDYVNGCAS